MMFLSFSIDASSLLQNLDIYCLRLVNLFIQLLSLELFTFVWWFMLLWTRFFVILLYSFFSLDFMSTDSGVIFSSTYTNYLLAYVRSLLSQLCALFLRAMVMMSRAFKKHPYALVTKTLAVCVLEIETAMVWFDLEITSDSYLFYPYSNLITCIGSFLSC